jgi:ribulose-phosphate 3-epimerase
MSRKVMVAPSILSADFGRLGEQLAAIDAGGADWVHVDVMDGHFVPNITIGPVAVKGMRPHTKLPFDVHLMISNPLKYSKAFADAGSDIITVHAEAEDDAVGALKAVRKLGKKAGVSINPGTPLSAVAGALCGADLLLVMTVQPGFAGQRFMVDVLPKLREARALVDKEGLGLSIEVDGGITAENAGLVAEAGADVLVAGSAIFCGKGSVAEEISRIRAAAMRHVH